MLAFQLETDATHSLEGTSTRDAVVLQQKMGLLQQDLVHKALNLDDHLGLGLADSDVCYNRLLREVW